MNIYWGDEMSRLFKNRALELEDKEIMAKKENIRERIIPIVVKYGIDSFSLIGSYAREDNRR